MERELDDWVEGFLFYTQESESPTSYLKWTAYSTISAAIQRHVWTKWIYWDYYPSIYVILVGPAGVTHKTSTIKFSINMLREVEAPLASDAITREALIQQMVKRSANDDANALAVTVSEFDNFIDASEKRMVKFLTDIYDAPDVWEYTTKHGGMDRIKNGYLTILGGAVPSWISSEFDEKFIEGGFVSRTLFVCESEPRFRKATANITPEMLKMREKLVQDLMQITTVHGEYKRTDAATEWWNHWYEEVWPRETVDYRLSGYHSRKPTHVLKISMLVAMSRSNELKITVEHFEHALRLIEELEPNMVEAFSGVGRNPYANDMERIAVEIAQNGGMSKGELIERNTHAMNRQVLDELIENLELMGKIKKELRGGTIHYLPGK